MFSMLLSLILSIIFLLFATNNDVINSFDNLNDLQSYMEDSDFTENLNQILFISLSMFMTFTVVIYKLF